jgi:Zn-dependent protease
MGALRIGRLLGVELAIHPSWLVIAFLITYSLAVRQFPAQFPGWEPHGLYWVVSAATSALFFASVVAHELSHAVVARRFGLRVSSITLFIFGGAASLEEEPKRARDEALIAAAGPAASLLLGTALLLVGAGLGSGSGSDHGPLEALLSWLGYINLSLGIFNLIPGFPMDGGRLLRALLWKLRRDEFAATRNAAAVGRAFGYLLVLVGVFLAFQPGGLFSGVWLALIGWFLSNAAEAAVARMSVERSLRGVKVRDLMDPDPASVGPNETVASLVHDRLLRGEHQSFLVRHPDGGLAGIVSLPDVRRVPRQAWEATRVTDIMTRFADLLTIAPDAEIEDALRLFAEKPVRQLPVVVEGRQVVGSLTRAGILGVIEARTKLGV